MACRVVFALQVIVFVVVRYRITVRQLESMIRLSEALARYERQLQTIYPRSPTVRCKSRFILATENSLAVAQAPLG